MKCFRLFAGLRRWGKTVLLVEQNAVAVDVADKGYVLELGTTVLSGTGPELLNNPDGNAYLGV